MKIRTRQWKIAITMADTCGKCASGDQAHVQHDTLLGPECPQQILKCRYNRQHGACGRGEETSSGSGR